MEGFLELATWDKPEAMYTVGKKLTLFPYEPVRPYGTPAYHSPRGVRNFDPKADFAKTQAKVQIEKIIRVGPDRESQIFSCKVLEAPVEERPAFYQSPLSLIPKNKDSKARRPPLTRKLVGKVNDNTWLPSCFFYGGWVTKVKYGTNMMGEPQFKYVGLILIEYIDDRSIEDLCFREDVEEGYIGELCPYEFSFGISGKGNQIRRVTFDEKNRQLVIQIMLHGICQGFQLGVEHHNLSPENVFVTLRNGTQDLEELRVVILDHEDTQKLPFPTHPRERCSVVALTKFQGWWPPSGHGRPADEVEKEFKQWLLSEEVVGPLVEATDKKDLAKPDKMRPYANKRYSTFDTLDLIGERQDAMLDVIIPQVLTLLRNLEDKDSLGQDMERAIHRALEKVTLHNTVTGSRHPPSHHKLRRIRLDQDCSDSGIA
ncbi:hypothetical protein CGLO_17454 [Colletotrichum gloeosporioides Cg-14]|uniref:Protein kinase domain-containing protein n=1 Tax=Colletotrichum gloeosporioides (strain Cg-14) TaxID=1237896 RepID=T0JWN4_COLGC|nr:hypothetical protein CGLO_17454 [Colletotrichum gloeosporioides Cg-14]